MEVISEDVFGKTDISLGCDLLGGFLVYGMV